MGLMMTNGNGTSVQYRESFCLVLVMVDNLDSLAEHLFSSTAPGYTRRDDSSGLGTGSGEDCAGIGRDRVLPVP
jgi:hypothetical protein